MRCEDRGGERRARNGGAGKVLNPVDALHTAARRYCIERAAEWERRYAALAPQPPFDEYSPQARDTFPRYHVLHAIQAAVEAIRPSELGSLDEARGRLQIAGIEAQNLFTRPPNGAIEERAMAEERGLFERYVAGVAESELSQVAALPYRRTLRPDESAKVWKELLRRWNGERGRLYPLDRPAQARPPKDTIAFEDEPFWDSGLQATVRDLLRREIDVETVWELREGVQPDIEIELALLEPLYTGDEGVWTDASFAWFIYASHESSVTVAGAGLLPALKQAWPEWRDHLYDPGVPGMT
jgi:hypothetical protein